MHVHTPVLARPVQMPFGVTTLKNELKDSLISVWELWGDAVLVVITVLPKKERKTNPNPNPDTIPPTVLKELSHQISPILEIIFNKSLQTGQVPNDWKEANVAPIFKKGDKHNPSNYRHISLTCIASAWNIS